MVRASLLYTVTVSGIDQRQLADAGLNHDTPSPRVPRLRPRRIRLEATSVCQLRCPACPTASGAIRPALGTGHLRASRFRQLIESDPGIMHIELSNYGELFLNPELEEILECAFHRGVRLTADNGANFNTVRLGTIEALVKFSLHRLTCSIDGATPETYARYRVGGDLRSVLANIEELNRYKKQYASPYPRLTWQFVVFPHNRHEIDAARRLAAKQPALANAADQLGWPRPRLLPQFLGPLRGQRLRRGHRSGFKSRAHPLRPLDACWRAPRTQRRALQHLRPLSGHAGERPLYGAPRMGAPCRSAGPTPPLRVRAPNGADGGWGLLPSRRGRPLAFPYSHLASQGAEEQSGLSVDISVVVPCRDSEQYIRACLDALLSQSFARSRYEVIVVDDGSTDRSSEFVSMYPDVRLLRSDRRGSYAARNVGAVASSGRILAFTDSDCEVCPTWIEQIEAAMREPGRLLLLGVRRFARETAPLATIADYEAEKARYVFSQEDRSLYYGYTNNMAVRRETLDRAGPFVEVMRGADVILVSRVVEAYGCSALRFLPEMSLRHLEIESWPDWARKMFLYGGSSRVYRTISGSRPLGLRARLLVLWRTARTHRYHLTRTVLLLALALPVAFSFEAGRRFGGR